MNKPPFSPRSILNNFPLGVPCKTGPNCCSSLFPCGEGEGGCSRDNQCQDGLVCGFRSVWIIPYIQLNLLERENLPFRNCPTEGALDASHNCCENVTKSLESKAFMSKFWIVFLHTVFFQRLLGPPARQTVRCVGEKTHPRQRHVNIY